MVRTWFQSASPTTSFAWLNLKLRRMLLLSSVWSDELTWNRPAGGNVMTFCRRFASSSITCHTSPASVPNSAAFFKMKSVSCSDVNVSFHDPVSDACDDDDDDDESSEERCACCASASDEIIPRMNITSSEEASRPRDKGVIKSRSSDFNVDVDTDDDEDEDRDDDEDEDARRRRRLTPTPPNPPQTDGPHDRLSPRDDDESKGPNWRCFFPATTPPPPDNDEEDDIKVLLRIPTTTEADMIV
mmetsp:Transcript_9144/g.20779  ORF Transcript_9144/g.20779 Transcript_9144/m.20779 type:complete len:243 (+) Transcript_9144:1335-2063(+)